MFRTLLIATFVACVAFVPASAKSQQVCGDRAKIVAHLDNDYKEGRSGIGLAASGPVIEATLDATLTDGGASPATFIIDGEATVRDPGSAGPKARATKSNAGSRLPPPPRPWVTMASVLRARGATRPADPSNGG